MSKMGNEEWWRGETGMKGKMGSADEGAKKKGS
jgi:hypothetical protein